MFAYCISLKQNFDNWILHDEFVDYFINTYAAMMGKDYFSILLVAKSQTSKFLSLPKYDKKLSYNNAKIKKGKIMASFSKLIEGKTPIINQIIAHAKVSDDIFILPEKPLNKNYNKNMTRNLKALYFSMSRSDKKDLFLGDLYEMILLYYEIENYFEFFDFVEFYKIMLKIRKIKEKHARYKYKNKSKFRRNSN